MFVLNRIQMYCLLSPELLAVITLQLHKDPSYD